MWRLFVRRDADFIEILYGLTKEEAEDFINYLSKRVGVLYRSDSQLTIYIKRKDGKEFLAVGEPEEESKEKVLKKLVFVGE